MSDSSAQESLLIEKIVPGGWGLARDAQGILLVEGAAVGDRVLVDVYQRRKGVRKAKIRTLIEASPQRAEPRCPVYGSCGGCDLQHLSYEAQLEAKAGIIADALIRQGGFSPDDGLISRLTVEGTDPWESRNRFQFHVVDSGAPGPRQNDPEVPVLGLKHRSSNEIIPLSHCPVAHPGVNKMLRELSGEQLREFVEAVPQRPGRKAKGRTTQKPSGGAYLGGNRSGEARRLPLYAWDGDARFAKGEVRLRIRDRELRFDVRGFFQSNLAGLEALLNWIDRMMENHGIPGGAAADLYCGVGLFGCQLPERFVPVFAVERNTGSLEYAKLNLGARGRCFALAAETWILGPHRPDNVSLMIVDPPREGLAGSLVQNLLAKPPEFLLYVACDPVTFARDAAVLSGGFTLLELQGFDFSPQNHHVELASLWKKT